MKTSFLGASVLATLLLPGCSLIPEYERPAAPVPVDWPTGPSYRAPITGTAIYDIGWRDFFKDERLQKLIEIGLANNRDLRVATLNIERARALYQIESANLYPSINASGGQNAQRLPGSLSQTGQAAISRQYSANIGFSSYEIDVFGRIRSLQEQALQQFLATQEAHDSVQITLISQIANAYLLLISDRDRLQLASETLKSQQESYALTKRSFELGASSELDLRQAQTTVDTARVDVARFTHVVAQDENLLALLIGTNSLPPDLIPSEPLHDITAISDIPAGLPSEILLRRPDVAEAERQLLAANANIGAARAAFYPRITLTAAAGSASRELSQLFKNGSESWSFIPFVSLPIFDGGANQAVLDTAKIDHRIRVAQYEKTIQQAFRETADALADYGMLDEQMAAQESLTEASTVSYKLSETRFRHGIDSYLSTLDSQRALYSAQQSLITVRLLRQVTLVLLYRTLGGGWKESN